MDPEFVAARRADVAVESEINNRADGEAGGTAANTHRIGLLLQRRKREKRKHKVICHLDKTETEDGFDDLAEPQRASFADTVKPSSNLPRINSAD